jgi:Nitroreductase family
MTKAANPMTADGATQAMAGPLPVTPIPATGVARLLATAARAPSVHNTQPWRFSVTPHLSTDPLVFPVIRDLIRTRLALPGTPQMLLQFGLAKASLATPRRSMAEFLSQS